MNSVSVSRPPVGSGGASLGWEVVIWSGLIRGRSTCTRCATDATGSVATDTLGIAVPLP